ncbi:MAG TPA: hypothetical protein VKK19_08515 [Candidatus Dormibacteraeota bacterium]|nr:hypothetical protein [Candidatus Dormibacteraeota bacterium]
MTVVRCTRKLLGLLAGSPMTSNMEPADDDWYADLLWLAGRKCLLMTHAVTLFSVFEPEISKASVNPIGPLAVRLIERELASEDLPPDTFGPLQASAFMMGRTSSRRVLGTMTDMRHQIAAAAHQSGGLGDIDIRSLNRSLRRIPFSAIRYERPIDRARALLDGTTGESAPLSVEPAQAPDRIEDLFARFLAERRKELSTKGIKNYEAIIEFFKHHLNGYAYESLSPFDRKRWDRAFDSGDEAAFCKLFGADKIPGEVGAFVGYFMIRKVIAPKAVIASTGRVIIDLLDWLVAEGNLRPDEIADARERAESAGSDLRKAEELAGLLYEVADRSDVDVHRLEDEDYVEDYLTISRVGPGSIWFEGNTGEIGPVVVGTAISRLARPGWSVNIVLGRVRDRWQVVEVGNVYPD